MQRLVRYAMALSPAVLFALGAMIHAPGALAHDGLNVNAKNKTCDIEFSANLTQGAFARFTREIGDIAVYNSDGVEVMPAGGVELGIAYSVSPIDQHSAAWNDTFTHPDATHPLGDAIILPTLRGRVGVGRDIDLGASFTGNPDASYRVVGLGLKRRLGGASSVERVLATSLNYGLLFGPDDVSVHALGIDVHAGRMWAALSAYASVGATWAHAAERSPAVALATENTIGPHVSAGVSPRVWRHVNVDLLGRFASVSTFELRLGHTF